MSGVPAYLKQDHPPRGLGEIGPGDTWVEPFERYAEALRLLPDSGGGGCHAALLGVANRGRAAGLDRDRIFRDLRARARGARPVGDREIHDAIAKAFSGELVRPPQPRVAVNGPRAFERICARGARFDEALLAGISPVVFDWPPERDGIEILRRLYLPDDLIFIGDKYDAGREHIRPAAEWIARFERGARVPPHIIPNPLTGKLGATHDGKPSYRADGCVRAFKFTTIEFDGVPIEKQIQFYGGVRLPIVALIHSGSKSIHAWVRADVSTAEEWSRKIEIELFNLLKPIGVDGTSRNEARLSRMPGCFRREKTEWQRILYLNLAGGPIQP